MAVKTFDPKQMVITVSGHIVSGYADGTFLNVEFSEDAYTSVAGADGEISRAKSNDFRGTVTITLTQTSLSNDVFSGLARVDRANNSGVFPILIKDVRGTTTISSGAAWIQKVAPAEFGKEIVTREWIIEISDAEIFIGGSPL